MIREILKKTRRAPQVLVENKMSFAAQDSELGIYDTFEPANQVKLASDQLLFCGMVSGKKVMHASESDYQCDFFPHESFVMAPNRPVAIDFPIASRESPTTCLAIEISTEKVQHIANHLSDQAPLREYTHEWGEEQTLLHTHHSSQTQALLERMVHIYTENHPEREFMIELAVSELIARLLRHQTRSFIIGHSESAPQHNGINACIAYISEHLAQPIEIDLLCKTACMSRTKFFSQFRQLLGCTPQEFLYQQRLKKAADLIEQGKSITAACYSSGYNNSSHFSRSFRRCYGISPSDYRARHCQKSTRQ